MLPLKLTPKKLRELASIRSVKAAEKCLLYLGQIRSRNAVRVFCSIYMVGVMN